MLMFHFEATKLFKNVITF